MPAEPTDASTADIAFCMKITAMAYVQYYHNYGNEFFTGEK